jgi:tRNA (cmo5U34)-methyltransferase
VTSDSTDSQNLQAIFPGEVFANTADFDDGIRQILPNYDEMLDAVANCLPANAQRILDLGCGTGGLSLKVFQRCPTAQIMALDYSPRMIEFAKAKLESAGYAQQWTGIQADFGDWANHQLDLADGFDACVSSLAIHHLTDAMKLKLFSRIRECLNPGGVFWNADPVLPEFPTLADTYQQIREKWAAQQGATLAEIRARTGKSTAYGHSNPDQLATLEAHLEMLKMAGFKAVAVPWKYYGLAVFGGRCP